MQRFFILLISLLTCGILYRPSFAGTIYLENHTIQTNAFRSADDHTESQYHIIQFSGPIYERQKAKVSSLGGHFISYLPLNSFIVHMSNSVKKEVEKLLFIQWVGPYKQHYRISSQLKPASIFNIEKQLKLIIELFPHMNTDPIIKQLKKNGAHVTDVSNNIIQVTGSRKSLLFLEGLDAVYWIDEDMVFGPVRSPRPSVTPLTTTLEDNKPDFNDLTGYESGNKIIGSSKLHDLGYTGVGQIIAFSDTGLDSGVNDDSLHPDFIGRIHSAHAYPDQSWTDKSGHGTHIAGSLVGNGTASKGGLRASAYQAKLVVESLVMNGRFRVPVNIGEKILKPAYDDGARIHSNSWGSKIRFGNYSHFSKSVDKFIWENPDILVLFTAGNKGGDFDQDGIIDTNSITIPGTAKNCLTVGSSENLILGTQDPLFSGIQLNWQPIGRRENKYNVEPILSDHISNNPMGIAAFSSRGPTRDERIKPDIVAPGTNILSTRSREPGSRDLWTPFNENYTWSGGTSTSTPIVASGIALIREYLVKHHKLENPSSALLKALVLNGANDLFPGQFGDIEKKEIPKLRPNVQEGWGRANIAHAILETEKRKIKYYEENSGLATSEEKEYHFHVTDSDTPIAVTLVYNDYPAATNSAKYLVNDLDLIVTDDQKNTYLTNGLSKRDDRNNVESVDILKPKCGKFTVKVSAFNVPQGKNGKQPYALVVSGGIAEKNIR